MFHAQGLQGRLGPLGKLRGLCARETQAGGGQATRAGAARLTWTWPPLPQTTREERIEEQLKGIPAKPGVYLFRDAKDAVLYVGKAKSLRARVRSYFRGGDARLGLDRLIERVERVEVIVTSTEVEAFHLEQNLIKRYRPTFNVRLRDDKSYPYIAVTVEDEYPRVMFTRERHRRGVVYFGPYASAKKVRETLDVLNRVFPYRPCEGPQPGRHSGIPCLDYHIERCLAPCVGYVSKEDYREIVERVIEFLSGETRPVLRELEEKMRDAAERQEFEEAARYRNRLTAVRHLAERQAADKRAIGTVDVIGIAAAGPHRRRAGLPAPRRAARRPAHLLPRERGGRGRPAAARVLLPRVLRRRAQHPAADRRAARRRARPRRSAGYLSDLRGLEGRGAAGAARREAAPPGARPAERRARARRATPRSASASASGASRRSRSCASASTSRAFRSGSSASTSRTSRASRRSARWSSSRTPCPKKAHYRKFGIKGVEGQDDFAMMAEVVSRRFARAREVTAERYDEGFAASPTSSSSTAARASSRPRSGRCTPTTSRAWR